MLLCLNRLAKWRLGNAYDDSMSMKTPLHDVREVPDDQGTSVEQDSEASRYAEKRSGGGPMMV